MTAATSRELPVGRASMPVTYVRPVDFGRLKPGEFDSAILWSGETATILISHVMPRGHAFQRHTHTGAQLYFTLRDGMRVDLGDEETFDVPAHSVVEIPAGLPHHNWNTGDQEEIHLEVITPSPPAGRPLATPTDEPAPAGLRGQVLPGDILSVPIDDIGCRFQQLLNDEIGTSNAVVNLVQVEQKGRSPRLHIHHFDQFYYVVSGRMNLQVALEEYVVGPDTLVVLPAGVPHRNWNDFDEPELHISVNLPQPEGPITGWDIPVLLGVGEDL
jgi:quercetin dioxygenase-like cupin family protein